MSLLGIKYNIKLPLSFYGAANFRIAFQNLILNPNEARKNGGKIYLVVLIAILIELMYKIEFFLRYLQLNIKS